MNKQTVIFTCLCASLLVACSGGPAGDSEANPDAVFLVSAFEGLYSLPRDWDGTNTEAFLEIETPNEAGEANVIVSREDLNRNCFESDFFNGTASKDEFSDRVFLDDVNNIEDSIISLVGSETLRIEPANGNVVLGTVITSFTSMDIQLCT